MNASILRTKISITKFKNRLLPILAMLGCVLVSQCLAGCAEDWQTVVVDTKPSHGTCLVENKIGHGVVPDTPGFIELHRHETPLMVACQRQGFKNGMQYVIEPKVNHYNWQSFNFIAYGLVHPAADILDGSFFSYPRVNIIDMHPTKHLTKKKTLAESEYEYKELNAILKKRVDTRPSRFSDNNGNFTVKSYSNLPNKNQPHGLGFDPED